MDPGWRSKVCSACFSVFVTWKCTDSFPEKNSKLIWIRLFFLVFHLFIHSELKNLYYAEVPLLKLDHAAASPALPGPLGETTVIYCRSASTHLHPQLDLKLPPPPPKLHSALLPAAWAIYRPCFISTPAGGQSCHSGPTEALWSTARE